MAVVWFRGFWWRWGDVDRFWVYVNGIVIGFVDRLDGVVCMRERELRIIVLVILGCYK